jgi:hypothetical protein
VVIETPAEAIQKLLSAARERDLTTFQAGMSNSFASSLKTEPGGSNSFGDFPNCEFARVRQIDEKTAHVIVRSIADKSREVVFQMILEDGHWKLNEILR